MILPKFLVTGTAVFSLMLVGIPTLSATSLKHNTRASVASHSFSKSSSSSMSSSSKKKASSSARSTPVVRFCTAAAWQCVFGNQCINGSYFQICSVIDTTCSFPEKVSPDPIKKSCSISSSLPSSSSLSSQSQSSANDVDFNLGLINFLSKFDVNYPLMQQKALYYNDASHGSGLMMELAQYKSYSEQLGYLQKLTENRSLTNDEKTKALLLETEINNLIDRFNKAYTQ